MKITTCDWEFEANGSDVVIRWPGTEDQLGKAVLLNKLQATTIFTALLAMIENEPPTEFAVDQVEKLWPGQDSINNLAVDHGRGIERYPGDIVL